MVGYDADLVVFDPEQRKVMSTEVLHEKVDWTPYDGIEMHGWPETTISRGQIIVDKEQFYGRQGQGRFVARHFDRL